MQVKECFLALNSSYDVMKAQKILLHHEIPIRMVATPREFSHNCGVVLSFSFDHIPRVEAIFLQDTLPNMLLLWKVGAVVKRKQLTPEFQSIPSDI